MALRRVRSKIGPTYESIVDDVTIARFPDDWEVLDDEAPPVSAVSRLNDEAETARPSLDDSSYR